MCWCWDAQPWPSGGPEDAVFRCGEEAGSGCSVLSVGASCKTAAAAGGVQGCRDPVGPTGRLHHTHTSPQPRSAR